MGEWIWESAAEDGRLVYRESKVHRQDTDVNGEIANDVDWSTREW